MSVLSPLAVLPLFAGYAVTVVPGLTVVGLTKCGEMLGLVEKGKSSEMLRKVHGVSLAAGTLVGALSLPVGYAVGGLVALATVPVSFVGGTLVGAYDAVRGDYGRPAAPARPAYEFI